MKRLTKAGRIASEAELKNVAAAKKDVGHIKRAEYSKMALRRVPKALHHLYGLPMKDRKRTEAEQKLFKASLTSKKRRA